MNYGLLNYLHCPIKCHEIRVNKHMQALSGLSPWIKSPAEGHFRIGTEKIFFKTIFGQRFFCSGCCWVSCWFFELWVGKVYAPRTSMGFWSEAGDEMSGFWVDHKVQGLQLNFSQRGCVRVFGNLYLGFVSKVVTGGKVRPDFRAAMCPECQEGGPDWGWKVFAIDKSSSSYLY